MIFFTQKKNFDGDFSKLNFKMFLITVTMGNALTMYSMPNTS